jgi:glycosyltransferase involved in cell wall biosynthesis
MSITVTVVIPAYKRTQLLRKAVLSTFALDFDPNAYEVIVVDSSPDDSNERLIAELQSLAPCTLRCLRKSPEGPGPSRNLGARTGKGEIIAFLDSDCTVSPGWLKAGLASFRPGIGIVQGRTTADPNGRPGVFTWYVSIERENFFYETCNIFYRREAFDQGGGFNPDFLPTADVPLGGEDVELAWKVKRLGWKVAFSREALVYHEVVRISPLRWLCEPRFFVVPESARRTPELRQFFTARYFYDSIQAYFALLLTGLIASFASSWFVVLGVPYIIARAGGTTRTLGGILRPLRVLFYLPRDAMTFCLLLAGSIRARCLLL